MKKQLTVLVLVFVFVLTLTGCATVSAFQNPPETRAEVRPAEHNQEAPVREMAPAAPQPAPAPTAPAPEAPSVPETFSESSGAMTKERAQQIALDYLGFTADQVTRMYTEYEVDDGIPRYDVEFHQGDWEYEFEIHGETGRILSFDKDHKYD
jgi:uncharacterized membrane protein YkoI